MGVTTSPDALVAAASSGAQRTFATALADARAYSPAPPTPGVLTIEVPGQAGRWVPVFSTPERLARWEGDADFFAASGADLVRLLPEGVGVLFDPQDRHCVALRFAPDPAGSTAVEGW
jgi:hypothetical protein